MDGLFTLVLLVLLFAASNWLKRRAQPEETELWPDETEPGDNQPPAHHRGAAPGEPAARPVRSSWEEELRRLLEGETPRRPEPKPTPAPPPIRPAVITPSRPVPAPPSPPPIVTATTSRGKARTIGQTAVALGRARESQRRAAEELRRAQSQIGGRPLLTAMERRRDRFEEIEQARAWFKSPQAARQAIIASVILGPPRAVVPSDNVPGLTAPGL